MAQNDDQLRESLSGFNLARVLEDLAREKPEIVQRIFAEDPQAAQLLRDHAESKLRDVQQSLAPAKKSAPARAAKRGWDRQDINGKVRDILRSR